MSNDSNFMSSDFPKPYSLFHFLPESGLKNLDNLTVVLPPLGKLMNLLLFVGICGLKNLDNLTVVLSPFRKIDESSFYLGEFD